MYDCIIIGSGAGGVSAALTLQALKLNFLLLGDKRLSHKIRSAEKIKNYPGLNCVSGREMQSAFLKQLSDADVAVTEGKANGVYPTDGGYIVACGQTLYEGKTVIIATGTEAKKPAVGELEFLGRGVSYCAVCDGFLYKSKTIAVYCESEEEADEVALLARYAASVLLYCPNGVRVAAENVCVVGNYIKEVKGDMRVRAVVGNDGVERGVDGVFMLKQSFGAQTLVHGVKTEGGFVVTDKAQSTNLGGVFAAGDCTGRPFQYAKAVGEGNVCAYSVYAYLKGTN